ncbi:MAG: hypothetical protein PHE89_06670 [Alphaproteobacteria bacterium]|nr:hypothetical protein [Alphaproteobacteria bacterium]
MNDVIKYSTKLSFIADGECREFNFNFKVFATSDVDVYVEDKIQTQGFAVTIAENGGEVIFNTAPPQGALITIIRNLPIKRTTDFQESGPFRATSVNGEFDYQTACLEQIEEKLSRVIYKPPYLTGESNLSLPQPIGGRALIWGKEDSGLKNSELDYEIIESQLLSTLNEIRTIRDVVKAKEDKIIEIDNHIIPNTHHLGEIFTDGFIELLEGQGWCAGDVLPSGAYSGLVAEFDKYTTDNAKGIAHIDFATYEASLLANNGNCILFGYDSINNLIRLPSIQDGVGIFQANNVNENNKFYNDQIQNITGTFKNFGSNGGLDGFSGAFYAGTTQGGSVTGSSTNSNNALFDASRVVRAGNETRNKQIRRRYKVQLANVGNQASESQYTGFIAGLTNKVDKDLENISNVGKELIISKNKPHYADSFAIEFPFTAPANGFVNINGVRNNGTVTLVINGVNILSGQSSNNYLEINLGGQFSVNQGDIVNYVGNAIATSLNTFSPQKGG